jgi:hypothetical protein
MLRSRKSRREEPLETLGTFEPDRPEPIESLASDDATVDPEQLSRIDLTLAGE